MNSINKKDLLRKVAVFMGGTSAERAVSIESGSNVLNALKAQGINAFAFDPKERPLHEILEENVSAVFMILHGQPGEDGRYQAFFDLHGIPYTGSGMSASAITIDKELCKILWRALDIPTPDFVTIDKTSTYENVVNKVGSPFVIKPANEGSSLGITIVKNKSQWQSAVNAAFQYRGAVLAEQYIKGVEYTFGVINNIALPGIRIDYQTEFYDYAAKYTDDRTQLVCPCGLNPEVEASLKTMALKAAQSVKCRGWYRVDFIVDDKGHPFVLEVNTAPGMTSHSLVPKAAAVYGWSYGEVLLKILEEAHHD